MTPPLAFAAGGDGLWQLVDDTWERVEAHGGNDLCRVPLALLARGSSPRAVAWRMPSQLAEGADQIRTSLDLDFFISSRWETFSVPTGTSLSDSVPPLALGPEGKLLIAAGQVVYESSSLMDRVADG